MLDPQELVTELAGVVVGRTGIHDFEEWLVRRTWNIHEWGDSVLRDAVFGVELALAEYSNGHIDGSRVRVALSDTAGELHRITGTIATSRPEGISTAELFRHRIAASPILVTEAA